MLSFVVLGGALLAGLQAVKWTGYTVLGAIPIGMWKKNREVKRWNKLGINPEASHLNPLAGFMSVTFTKEEVPVGFEALVGNWVLTESELYQLFMFMELNNSGSPPFKLFLEQLKLFSKNRVEDQVIRSGLRLAQKTA